MITVELDQCSPKLRLLISLVLVGFVRITGYWQENDPGLEIGHVSKISIRGRELCTNCSKRWDGGVEKTQHVMDLSKQNLKKATKNCKTKKCWLARLAELWVEVGQEVSCPDSSLLFDSLDGIRQIRKLRCLAQFLLIYDIQVKPRKVYMFVVFIYCSLVPIFALCPRCCTKSEIIPALWGVVN